ncbi:MAG: response regulator [Candidatus Moranbacteria bacterium]|jgi:DNA-binding response OmpR family regulator|nr:response regulator [Candidatus Moranbacteria bacterium]
MDKKKIKILVVEDDIFISEMYNVKLSSSGFDVDMAEDGEEALKKIASDDYDVILLDIIMPKINGWDVLEKIKDDKKKKGYKIIMLTNVDDQEDIRKAIENGADDYLIKSLFTPGEVVQKIQKNISK